VWECLAGGLKKLTQAQYESQPVKIQRHYTKIPKQAEPVAQSGDAVDAIYAAWHGAGVDIAGGNWERFVGMLPALFMHTDAAPTETASKAYVMTLKNLTDIQICEIGIASKSIEPGRDGYILPVKFGRALLAAADKAGIVNQESTTTTIDANTRQILKTALGMLKKYSPCFHDGEVEYNLGDGQTWVKCENCQLILDQSSLPGFLERAEEFNKVIQGIEQALQGIEPPVKSCEGCRYKNAPPTLEPCVSCYDYKNYKNWKAA
jgi:hypothetical protein